MGDLSGRAVLPPIPASKKDSLGELSSLKERAVFSLSPSRVELFPGCSVDMVLSGSADSPKVRALFLTPNREEFIAHPSVCVPVCADCAGASHLPGHHRFPEH